MRLEDLKYELPETPDFIHSMIQEEVSKQIKEDNMIPFHKKIKTKCKKARVAAAVLACVMATSTAVYAGSKLYHMYLEHQGTYRVVTGIKAENGGNTFKIPERIQDISFSAGYIPAGMEWTEEGFKLSYATSPYQGGISIDSVLMDNNDIDTVISDRNVIESEAHTFGTYEGVYLKYNSVTGDNSFNQRIYMLAPEDYRVLILYIGNDVSKEDAFQFAESLKITKNGKMLETDKMYTWSDFVHPKTETMSSIVTNGKIPVHQIRETFALNSSSGEDKNGKYMTTDGITARVDDVQIADNLQLLNDKDVPEEWKNVLGKDGKLKKNHLSYIKSGDGIKTLDKIVDEKDVNQKLVYTTVTYTNTTEKEIDHLLYIGSLMTLSEQKDGTYSVYCAEETKGEGYDYYKGDGVAHIGNMPYHSEKEEYGNGGNYISSLKPGESIQINMAWIVNETDLKNLYLNLNGTGASYEFDDSVLKTGVVYIGK